MSDTLDAPRRTDDAAGDAAGDATDDLTAKAAALVPAIAARAVETEGLRRLPDATVAALKAAGLHRICQPARYGGAEADLDRACDIVMTLARGCASTAWVVGVWTDHQILAALFGERARDEIWADTPDAVISAGLMPAGRGVRAEGGWRVSGTWGWSSGCDHADWFILNSMLPTGPGGTDEPHYCLLPRADVTIDDNWRVMGMAGTGSKNAVVAEVLVPDHRTLPSSVARDGRADARDVPALFRLPHPPCVPFLLVAPSVGLAEGLYAAVVADMGARRGPGGPLAELATLQMHVAEAAGEIDAARLLLMRDTGTAMAAMRAGRALTLDERARNRRDHALVVKLCRQAADRLFTAVGGHGIFTDGNLQRQFRDMHALSGHFAFAWDIAGTTFGRVAFGLDPQHPLI